MSPAAEASEPCLALALAETVSSSANLRAIIPPVVRGDREGLDHCAHTP